MAIKLNLKELNKLFEKPTSHHPVPTTVHSAQDRAWLEQFFTRVHLVNSVNVIYDHKLSVDLSPMSSNSTLVDDDAYNFSCKLGETPSSIYTTDRSSHHFVEEIDRRNEHRRSLSLNTNVSSCISTCSPSSSISSLSITFNPNATPFIPTYALQPLSAPATTPPLTTDLSDLPWFPYFWAGVSSKDTEIHTVNATGLVDSITWDTESLAVLSQHFCWKGADGTEDGVSGVAGFARVVHTQISEKYGDWYANCLTRHIRECVVSHFKGCWKSDQPLAITHTNIPSTSYLASALSLTTFVGALFAHGLLPRSTIHHCLSILVAELCSTEHIHAIHLLLLHATAKLWRGKDVNKAIKDFVAGFTQRASCVGEKAGEGASIMGGRWSKNEIRAWVKEITDMINKWQVTRRIQQDDTNLDFIPGDKLVSFGLRMAKRR